MIFWLIPGHLIPKGGASCYCRTGSRVLIPHMVSTGPWWRWPGFQVWRQTSWLFSRPPLIPTQEEDWGMCHYCWVGMRVQSPHTVSTDTVALPHEDIGASHYRCTMVEVWPSLCDVAVVEKAEAWFLLAVLLRCLFSGPSAKERRLLLRVSFVCVCWHFWVAHSSVPGLGSMRPKEPREFITTPSLDSKVLSSVTNYISRKVTEMVWR